MTRAIVDNMWQEEQNPQKVVRSLLMRQGSKGANDTARINAILEAQSNFLGALAETLIEKQLLTPEEILSLLPDGGLYSVVDAETEAKTVKKGPRI